MGQYKNGKLGIELLSRFTIPRHISQAKWKDITIDQDIVHRDESGIKIDRITTYLEIEVKVHQNGRYFKIQGEYIYNPRREDSVFLP